jgi:hypothetical protein
MGYFTLKRTSSGHSSLFDEMFYVYASWLYKGGHSALNIAGEIEKPAELLSDEDSAMTEDRVPGETRGGPGAGHTVNRSSLEGALELNIGR